MKKSSSLRNLAWDKQSGLLPAIVQDDASGQVLMLGYMNKAAFDKSLQTGNVWFYSRSKKRLWMKGESSGNVLRIKNITKDCDRDTFLIRVTPSGPTCHTGEKSCFMNAMPSFEGGPTPREKLSFSFDDLYRLIEERKKDKPAGSYTAQLFRKGLSKISGKVIEEVIEVVQAATSESKKRLIEESVDLLYHLFVLLVAREISIKGLSAEIKKRRKGKA